MGEGADVQAARRRRMVDVDLACRGIYDPVVLHAMDAVPRELFVPAELVAKAYDDTPLPVGFDQTISQPLVVAMMVQAAELCATDTVLEVGAGSGYAAAVLANIVARVISLERIEDLVRLARGNLEACGLGEPHVAVRMADGARGWPDEAPYEAILVAAAAEEVPAPLLAQLTIGGRLVLPIGVPGAEQRLVVLRRLAADLWRRDDLGAVRFVPLVRGVSASSALADGPIPNGPVPNGPIPNGPVGADAGEGRSSAR